MADQLHCLHAWSNDHVTVWRISERVSSINAQTHSGRRCVHYSKIDDEINLLQFQICSSFSLFVLNPHPPLRLEDISHHDNRQEYTTERTEINGRPLDHT